MSAKQHNEDVVRAATGRVVRSNLVLAGLMATGALLTLAQGSIMVGVLFLFAAGFAVWGGRLTARSGNEAYALNAAYQLYFAGKHQAALAELDGLEAKAPMQYIVRAARLQRVAIAFHAGDLAAAAEQAKRATEGTAQRMTRLHEQRYVTEARAYLLLIQALRDEPHDAGLEQLVRDDAEGTASSRARVELARLIRLERENKLQDLESGVAKHRSLLMESLSQRERELLHAIQRKLTRRSPGVYREAAEREAVVEESDGVLDRAAWAERVSPSLAPFIRPSGHRGGDADVARLAATPTSAKASSVATPSGAAAKFLVRFVIAFVVFLAIAAGAFFFTLQSSASATSPLVSTTVVPFAVATALVAFVIYLRRTQRTARVGLATVTRTAAMGLPADVPKLTQLERSRFPLIAAEAALVSARESRKAGHFQAVEERTRHGITRAVSTQQARVLSSHLLLPTLLSERAAALAALGRDDEALAEVAQLEASFPAFPLMPVTRHAVATMLAARAGDLPRLSELGKASQAFPAIDHRTQFLGDLARAAIDPETVGAAEIARIKKDLAQDDALRVWVDKINPDLAPALDRGVQIAAEDEASSEENDESESRPVARA